MNRRRKTSIEKTVPFKAIDISIWNRNRIFRSFNQFQAFERYSMNNSIFLRTRRTMTEGFGRTKIFTEIRSVIFALHLTS